MPSLKLSYSLTYKTNSLDISSICDSTQTEVTRNLCTQEFKSAIDTATIVIKCSRGQYTLRSDVISIIQDAMDSLEPIELKIQCNGFSIFKGYLDLSEVSFSSKKGPESITLSAEDISAKILDVSVDEYVILEDKHISEIIEYLVALAGGGNLYKNKILEKDDHVIPVFAIDKEDDNDTFRDYIDTLLFEAGGYVLDTDEEGRMSIIALPWESYEPTRVVDNYLLEDGIETTRQIFNKTGLKLTWSTLAETPKEQTVWTADFSRTLSDGKLIGKEVAAGAYYPEDGDVTASYQEYSVDFLDREYNTNQSRTKNNDLSIIAVRDVSATIITTDVDGNDLDNDAVWEYPVLPSLGMEVNPTLYAKKAWYLLRNKTDDAVNLQFFTLQGRVLYRSKINYLTIPYEAKSLEEYTSTYIFTNEHAKRFASFYWNFLKTSQTIHKWTEIGDATLGEVVLINHKESEFGQATLIVGATLSFVGNTAKVECIGVAVGAYNEYKMKEWASSATSKPNGPSGTAAPATQIMYKWGKYQDIPPIQDGVWFFAGRPIFYKGAIWGDLTGSAWTDVPTERPDDSSYLWMKTSVDGGKTWTYACIQLPPIIDFTIFASDVTYNMSSRGVVLSSKTIKLTVVKQNTNADCTWHVTPESLIDGSESGSIVADSFEITIPEGFTETVVKITAQVGNLSEKNVQINGVLAGESEPMYLGEYPKDGEDKPTKSPYGDLIKGDYILYYSTVSSEETGLFPMYWTGYEWRPVVPEVENYSQIMGTILGDVLNSDATVTSTSALYGFFKNLASEAAFIEQLFARLIKITGAIYGGSFNEDGTDVGGAGFYLSAIDGVLRAIGAILKGSFECSDDSGIILKTYYGQTGATLSSSEKIRWDSRSLCNAIEIGRSGQATYNGSAYNYKRADANNPYRVFNAGYLESAIEYSFTAPFDCSIHIYFSTNNSIFGNESYTITVNGITTEYTSGSKNLYYNFKKGDTLKIKASGMANLGKSCYLEMLDDAVFLYQNQTVYYKFANYVQAHSYSLEIPGIFSSGDHITLASISGWTSGLTVNHGYDFADTTIMIDDEEYTPVSAVLTSEAFYLTTADGSQFIFQTEYNNDEFAETGWYNYSGDLTLQIQLRGTASASLYPSIDSAILGRPDLYYLAGYISNIYSKNIVGETLLLSNLPTSSAGLPAGSLYNDGGTVKVVT